MVKRVSHNTQFEQHFRRGGFRRTVYLGVSPWRQPNGTGLHDVIRRLIAVSRICGGPEIEFCDDRTACELQPELQMALSAVVRELLVNAICYSESMTALVRITQSAGHLRLLVQDWGTGFDPHRVAPHKYGLQEARDLVRGLGGTMSIDSQPGAGSCVIIEIPLSHETAANHPVSRLKPR
ncbi:MAG: sensor histidine kinase [Pirellulaceae bacterium]